MVFVIRFVNFAFPDFVAQLVEQLTLNQRVESSSLSEVTFILSSQEMVLMLAACC